MKGRDVARCARAQVGKSYKWATAGPNTFDCSGLTSYCYGQAGVTISRSSYDQAKLGTSVPLDKVEEGDILVYGGGSHVGVVVGPDRAVHALNEDLDIKEVSISQANLDLPFDGARRIIPKDDGAGSAPGGSSVSVTPQSNFRNLGNTDRESFTTQLSRTVTPGFTPPPLAEADAIYDALFMDGLTRLGAAMAWIERSNETNDADLQYYGRNLRNLWAVKNPNGTWARYESYAAAARMWRERILGPTYADLTTVADFIARYAPWSDGNDPQRYGQRVAALVNSMPLMDEEPPVEEPQVGFKVWNIPGLGQIKLPESITVEVILTPVGVHRPARRITPTGSTLHETGNRGYSAGARMHSNWQDGCTQGHPDGYVGVSMYVENRLVIIKIPLNESSIHSGDWRNNSHPSMEVCVNASRNAEQTEDTAMWMQAAILLARGQNAQDHLYPHTPSGCPAIINSRGRWPSIEQGVDERIALLRSGGSIPPAEEYAESKPIPKEWDGTDYVRESDGHRFYALQRVFVTNKETAARQSASPTSRKVRRNLRAGEAFLSYYITEGAEGMWLISQYGSRIFAADCTPRLGVLIGTEWRGDMPDAEDQIIIDDPSHGLSATDVPEDAPAIEKQTFMQADS
jgi:hypothetical protein